MCECTQACKYICNLGVGVKSGAPGLLHPPFLLEVERTVWSTPGRSSSPLAPVAEVLVDTAKRSRLETGPELRPGGGARGRGRQPRLFPTLPEPPLDRGLEGVPGHQTQQRTQKSSASRLLPHSLQRRLLHFPRRRQSCALSTCPSLEPPMAAKGTRKETVRLLSWRNHVSTNGTTKKP